MHVFFTLQGIVRIFVAACIVYKMDESALNSAMDAAMKRSDSQKGKITKQEAESFKKAFAKPEFRDLFNDYLKEVYLIFMAFNSFSFPFQINMEFEMLPAINMCTNRFLTPRTGRSTRSTSNSWNPRRRCTFFPPQSLFPLPLALSLIGTPG